jgi:hypothetical protein
MITTTCGKVIEAKKEKNKALKISLSLKRKYSVAIPISEIVQ